MLDRFRWRSPEVLASTAFRSPRLAFRLVVELEQGRERRLALPSGDLVLGSAAECDVRIEHPSVSRRHLALEVGEREVRIRDLGSRNGTRLGGSRLAGEVLLEPGTALVVGTVPACLERVADAEVEAAVQLDVPSRRTPPPKLREGDGRSDPATVAAGPLYAFVSERLPRLLELVGERAAPDRLARAVGAALHDLLPSLRVEASRRVGGAAGILFEADRPGAGRGEVVEATAGDLRLTVELTHESQARAYADLVQTAARILALAPLGSPAVPPERPGPPPLPEPETVDPALRRLYAEAVRIAAGEVSALLVGESGTGKEVLARYLHAASPRAQGPFVALNCATLPRDLLEAELFGIEKGVATGVEPRPGKFELASGGTLFLDEIGDMAPETQASILRVLQEREVYRVGGHRAHPADVRVVSATNRDLDELRTTGAFRLDLFHRVADWVARLPPLRERRGDVANLAAHFLAREASKRGVEATGISRAALAVLVAAPWPGNVRQLEREMARAALFLEPRELVERRHLSAELVSAPRDSAASSLRDRLESAERSAIARALAASGGEVGLAARELGVGRSTLYRRIKELGLQED